MFFSLLKHSAIKKYGKAEVKFHALDEANCLGSRSSRFTPGEEAPDTHSIGGRMDLGVGIDAVAKRKIPAPTDYLTTSVVHPVANLLTELSSYPGSWSSLYVKTNLELYIKSSLRRLIPYLYVQN
jgi:hypothetical protein